MANQNKNLSAFAIVSLVIGIIAVLISFIPFLNLYTIPLAAIALLCGVVTIITVIAGHKRGLIEAIIGMVLAVIGFSISGAMYQAIDDSIDEHIIQNQITVTADDISSIKEGVSYEDVVEILGEPNVNSVSGSIKTCNWTTYGYVGDEASYYSVSVTFKDGIATSVLVSTDVE